MTADTLRVRSQPIVGEESIKYEPLLKKGQELILRAGTATGSGYWWYEVEVAPGVLDGGITRGWLAAGDRDGRPHQLTVHVKQSGASVRGSKWVTIEKR